MLDLGIPPSAIYIPARWIPNNPGATVVHVTPMVTSPHTAALKQTVIIVFSGAARILCPSQASSEPSRMDPHRVDEQKLQSMEVKNKQKNP